MLFRLSGFDSRSATSGEDALLLTGAFTPDVVVLDLMMPGMDGYELASHLRERFRWPRRLLVTVTGHATRDDHRRSDGAGFDLHLNKPVEPAVLVRVLRRFTRVVAPARPSAVRRPPPLIRRIDLTEAGSSGPAGRPRLLTRSGPGVRGA